MSLLLGFIGGMIGGFLACVIFLDKKNHLEFTAWKPEKPVETPEQKADRLQKQFLNIMDYDGTPQKEADDEN